MNTIRRAVVGDSERIAGAQARAFFDDPLQSWAIPDSQVRLGLLEEMFELLTRVVSVPNGHAFVDDECTTAALWVAPGLWGEPLSSQARDALRVLDDRLEPRTTRRFGLANEAMHAAHPHDRHWYLQGLGTDPAVQRLGRASAALMPILREADATHMPCYLESTKADNVGFYEHHGFVITGTLSIDDGGPTLWAMWREPVRP